MRIVQGNIGRGNLLKQFLAFVVMFLLAPRGGIHCFQEIGESDGRINEPKRLKAVYRGFTIVGMWTHCPVAFNPKKWRLLKSDQVPEDGKPVVAGIRNTWPNMYIQRVRLLNKKNGERVTVFNNHFVPGAFNHQDNPHDREALAGWNHHWNELRKAVQAELDAGFSVYVCGDFNRQGQFPLLHNRAKMVKHAATDRIYAVPHWTKNVKVGKTGTRRLGVDFHPAIYADIEFINKKGK